MNSGGSHVYGRQFRTGALHKARAGNIAVARRRAGSTTAETPAARTCRPMIICSPGRPKACRESTSQVTEPMKEVIPYQPEFDAIDWRTSMRRAKQAVVRHTLLIMTSCVVALVLLALYIKVFPPVYKANALIMAEGNDDVIRANYYENWNVFRKWDVKSEPELITSGRVARQVVDSLHLKFDDVYHTFFTHVGYLWTDSWVGKKYHRFKEWLFPPGPAAYKPTPEEIETARTVDSFKDGVSVEIVPDSTVAKVVVVAPSYRAAEIANKIVDVYLAERTKMLRAEADESYKSLHEEADRAAVDLAAADKVELDFESKNKVVLGFEKDRLQVANWAALETTIKDLKSTVASLEASLAVVEQQLQNEPREIVSGRTLQDSKVKGLLEAREMDLRNSLLQSSQKYAPDSPEVTDLKKLLSETQAMLDRQPDKVEVGEDRIVNPVYTELRQKENNLRAQLASSRAALAAKQAPLAEYENRMALVPKLSETMLEQSRFRDGLEMRYKVLRQRMMQAEVSRAAIGSASPSVQVIDYASPPMKPIWPKNIILVPSALAVGLLVGFILAMLAEIFSSRVNRDRLVSHPEIPVYAVIDLRPDGPPALPGPISGDTRSVVERLRRLS